VRVVVALVARGVRVVAVFAARVPFGAAALVARGVRVVAAFAAAFAAVLRPFAAFATPRVPVALAPADLAVADFAVARVVFAAVMRVVVFLGPGFLAAAALVPRAVVARRVVVRMAIGCARPAVVLVGVLSSLVTVAISFSCRLGDLVQRSA
jgi:hypothetical protein